MEDSMSFACSPMYAAPIRVATSAFSALIIQRVQSVRCVLEINLQLLHRFKHVYPNNSASINSLYKLHNFCHDNRTSPVT